MRSCSTTCFCLFILCLTRFLLTNWRISYNLLFYFPSDMFLGLHVSDLLCISLAYSSLSILCLSLTEMYVIRYFFAATFSKCCHWFRIFALKESFPYITAYFDYIISCHLHWSIENPHMLVENLPFWGCLFMEASMS